MAIDWIGLLYFVLYYAAHVVAWCAAFGLVYMLMIAVFPGELDE